MSQDVRDFFETWARENVTALPIPDHFEQAQLLAKRCLESAAGVGISEAALERELGQDVVSELRRRIDEKTTGAVFEAANQAG